MMVISTPEKSLSTAVMQKQQNIYKSRLQRFISHDYGIKEDNLFGLLIRRRDFSSIKLSVWSPPPGASSPPSFQQAIMNEFRPVQVGAEFGPSWSTHWFRLSITLPEGWQHAPQRTILRWKCAAEGLVWTEQGEPVHGLSEDRTDFKIDLVNPKGSSHIILYIELACNSMFGNAVGRAINPPDEHRFFKLEACELLEMDDEAMRLYCDLQILLGMVESLPEGDPRGKEALYVANEIINTFGRPELGTVRESLCHCQRIADAFIHGTAKAPGSATLSHFLVSAVGNCHIDTAWLWRYGETRRKTARSWSAQLALMEKHPRYKFVASQMQQLEWLRIDYPGLFERIKEWVRRGNFIPIGGAWVEMDGNMPSGESFVRQLLYGQKFMREHFGMRSEIFWLPDTFGYNAQMPQIMKQAGMPFFLTQKISWNNIDRFPHSSFWWEGIDGSQVLVHFPPANTYTSMATVDDVLRTDHACRDRDRTHTAMLLYGYGDGGGGPTESMLARLERMADTNILPTVRFEHPKECFARLQTQADRLLTWHGELYLELHRGTYTSQARMKHYNRRCETLLREAEMLSFVSGVILETASYPAEELEALWKDVLLNQFHDVLPGSSIADVYVDAARLYENVELKASNIRDRAMNALFGNRVSNEPTTGGRSQSHVQQQGIVFFNTTPYQRDEVLLVPYDGMGQTPQPGVLAVSGIMGHSMATFVESQVPTDTISFSQKAHISRLDAHYVMENHYVRVKVDSKGHLVSLYDKEVERELIPVGEKANRLMMYEDIPIYWDAWDVELYHLEKGWCVSEGDDVQLEIGMEGPLLVSLVRQVPLSAGDRSHLTQVISLNCLSKRVEFNCRVEWRESHRLLKVDFPLAIASDFATFECPYGLVRRPTHMNTSWEVAKFEVCGHRFADLSEHDYGAAVLNDCKYGYSVRGSLIQLSLLRSPKMPDPTCDMGSHMMRFALLPHRGDVIAGRVIEEAVKLNTPLLWTSASASRYDARWLNTPFLQFAWHHANHLPSTYACGHGPSIPLAIEAVKMAEDGSGDVIIRAYEPHGGRGTAIFSAHPLLKILSLWPCTLLEEEMNSEERVVHHDEITSAWLVHFTPFKIITLRARIVLRSDLQQTSREFEDAIILSPISN